MADKNQNTNTLLIKAIVIIFGVLLITLSLIFDLQKALVLSTIVSAIFLVFMFSHLERNLRTTQFEINPSNKDPEKGLLEYEKEIENFLFDLSYERIENTHTRKTYRPRLRQRIMGGDLHLEKSPYLINIKGPVGILRILSKVVDIDFKKGQV